MTYQHSVAVAENMNKLAQKMGLDEQQVLEAELLGAIHELGKLQTPPAIFQKLQAGQSITPEERAQLAHDPQTIIETLGQSWLSPSLIQAIEHMGCRYDGKGQPAVGAENIPQLARFLKVCDLFDLFCRRRNGAALAPEKALEGLKKNAGSLLDPIIVEIFCELQASGS
jgi:HD-GYP domain-containing protein (c-di-GMP phosphodiesterase class II)